MKLKRREFVTGALATTASTLLGGMPAWAKSAEELYENAIVIDSLSASNKWDELEYESLERSGYTGIFGSLPNQSFDIAVNALGEWQERIRQNPDTFILATGAGDFVRAKEEDKLAVLMNFQNSVMLEGKVENLDTLFNLGLRSMQLTYNSRNLIGDGCLERTNAGVSDFGVEVISRMNELGVIVDVSHSGRQTTFDAIELSNRPVAFTHTMCEAIRNDHPRAKTDEQIRALVEKGGVMAIAALGYFVGPNPGPDGDTDIEDYVDHIDHAVKVAGIEHVGICTDFAIKGLEAWATREEWYVPRLSFFKPSYQVRWPPWIPALDVPERFLNLTRVLQRRGYKDADIEKLLGQNWLRFIGDVVGA